MRFWKLHGLGNDFVLLDRRGAGPLPPSAAIRLCDRHEGIGADGVLSVLDSPRAPLRMHLTNSDGSVAEMCGNGLRCVIRWGVSQRLLSPDGGAIDTDAGLRSWAPEGEQYRVDMGEPSLSGPDLPADVSALPSAGRLSFVVSMGNPHLVLFAHPGEDVRVSAEREGPALERHPLFPARTNVEFVRSTPQGLEVAVWERGAGLTRACGTGACASAVAAVQAGLAREGEPLAVRLPGGVLQVRVEPGLRRVWMTGPAALVFSGEIPDETGA